MEKERKDGSLINDGINENTYNLLFSDKENISTEDRGSIENLIAYATIDKFTMIQEKKIIFKLLKAIYKNKIKIDLDKITFNKETNRYEYRDLEKIFVFDKLSDKIDSNKFKKELMSKKRYHHCHLDSIRLSLKVKNSRVLTGYITLGSKKYIHSVVEYEVNNQTIILDWTRNFRMLKEDYLELTNFKELSSIEGSKVIAGIKVIADIEKITSNLNLGLKAYLIFQNEIIRDLERNSYMFEQDSELKLKIQNLREKINEAEDKGVSNKK